MILDFLLTILRVTASQLVAIFGLCFVSAFVLAYLERQTQRIYVRVFGWRAILWTGWIGTPVHEISHIIFAKLFRHRVTEFSLFRPDPSTGRLGHVNHSYNPRSIYQQLGNFFIGAAPLIGGSLLLLVLLYVFVPQAAQIFDPLHFSTTLDSLTRTLSLIFSPSNLASVRWWIFVYVSLCIVSHIAPSRADVQGMWLGAFGLIVLLCLGNTVGALIGRDISSVLLRTSQYSGILAALFVYALILAFAQYLLASILLAPFSRRR